MKKFIKYCILFLMPIGLSAVLFEIFLRQIPNPYTYKYEWMQEHADEVETLVFGSSHAMYGIRPEYLSGKAFNLAFESQVLAYDDFLLEYSAPKYKKLKTVILPISYFTFFLRFEDEPHWYKARYHHIYMDCKIHPYSLRYNFELGHYMTAKKKFYDFVKKVRDNKPMLIIDQYGWGTIYKHNPARVKIWSKPTNGKKIWETAKDWSHVDEIMVSFERIAEFCKSRNIQLVLITTPTWKSYYENLDKAQLEKMYDLIHEECEKYHLVYLDYLRDSRFTETDFHDVSHLSDVGAAKFTKILNEDIRNIGE